MIQSLQHRGRFLRECPFPGETRAEEVFPAHANGLPVSRDRFLIVYATRGYRGTDDDRSIVAQLRRDAYDGPVLREVMLSQSVNDWDPLGTGAKLIRQHGHPVAFGVPKGARFGGQPATHANVFVIKWRVRALAPDPATGLLDHQSRPDLGDATQGVEWMQVQLNDRDDDLEILQPPARLESLPPGTRWMNQTFVQAVPLNPEATEWADVNHFDGERIAALRYRFEARAGRYEHVQTGPLLGGPGTQAGGLSEASLLRYRDDWIIAARRHDPKEKTVAWARLHDLFAEVPRFAASPNHHNHAPLAAYGCPDGVVRLLGGDFTVSPYRNGRDPLYLWDVDPEAGFAVANRRVVFDCVRADIGIPQRQFPCVDMGKLLPHAGGATQFLVHRVRSKATKDARKTGLEITPAEMAAGGLYYATVEYTEPWPGMWQFPQAA